MLNKIYRVNKPTEFTKLFKNGKRSYAPGVRIFRTPNTLGHNRFGFIATKKVGNSVVRHHTMRILREAVRPALTTGSYDYLILVQPGFEENFKADKMLQKL